jgi:hypothetical protein
VHIDAPVPALQPFDVHVHREAGNRHVALRSVAGVDAQAAYHDATALRERKCQCVRQLSVLTRGGEATKKQ